MSKPEKLGVRASLYSSWHRTLGDGCFATDLDWVEWRADRGIVALIDVTGNMHDDRHITNSKQMIWNRTNVQREVLITISKALNVPAYFVLHTTELDMFHVHNLANDLQDFTKMTRYQYTEFVKSL